MIKRITRFEIVTMPRFTFQCLQAKLYNLVPEYKWLKNVKSGQQDPATGDWVFEVEEEGVRDEKQKRG